MNIGAFAVVMPVARGRPGNRIEDYRDLPFRRRAVVGLPPDLPRRTAAGDGLFVKAVVFRELVGGDADRLAVVMAVNTLVGLCCHLSRTAGLLGPEPPGGREPYRRIGRAEPVGVAIAPLPAAAPYSIASQVVPAVLPSAVG